MQGLSNVPVKELLLVIYGGLFGWTLGKLPVKWIYVVLAVAILLTIVVVL
jgi:hypothetical protein